jgi:hypothetical protein
MLKLLGDFRMKNFKSLAISVLLFFISKMCFAAVIYESATLGPTGINGGAAIGYKTTNEWQMGCRFSIKETTQVTAVGGHIGNMSLDEGHFDPDAEIYAAIVAMDSPSSYPSFLPSEIETYALATVTFKPGASLASSEDLRIPLSILLEPGNYGLIFGAGLLGTDGEAAMPLNNPVLPGASFFGGLSDDVWRPVVAESEGMRFVVEGYVIDPPFWDTDADGKTDITIWRPSTGVWYMLPSNSPGSYIDTPWGMSSDVPASGDYDGDGKSDIAVWRLDTGVWYVLPSNSPGTYTSTQWGVSSDIPVQSDYDGDGTDDIAVWRPSGGMWYILPSNSPGTYTAIQWGATSDIPVPADYDGDGKTDLAVWRPSEGVWYVLPSNSPGTYTSDQWGVNTDIPTPGDYDADGKTDVAVWRPSEGMWYVLPSASPGSYTSTQWGVATDIPAAGDYDGDGRSDIAVWRADDGVWYIMPSGSPGTYTATQWGAVGDEAISGLTGILRSIP